MSNPQNPDNVPPPQQTPQANYGYPSSETNQDEIDLGALLEKLIGQSKLILTIVAVGTLLSVAVALLLPRIYQQEVILSMPVESNIAVLNANGSTEYTPIDIFKRYYDSLRSPDQFESFVKDRDYLGRLYPDSDQTDSTLIWKLKKNFVIDVLEPAPEQKGLIVTMPERIGLKIRHRRENVITDLLNEYVDVVGNSLILDIISEQKVQIGHDLATIDRSIALLRLGAAKERENEIIRIQEALRMAKKLQIEKPTYLGDFSNRNNSTSSKTEINLSDNQELPLYLMGVDYLEVRLEELINRGSYESALDESRDLKEEIISGKDTASVREHKNDDPYIEELPALLAEKEKLQRLSLNFDGAKMMKAEKSAVETGESVKPNRMLIVIIGAVLSGFLAVLIGLIASVMSGRNSGARITANG
jgi:LPS O-antigen subunit length determinant protein (WzzB/FepE family)